MKNAELIKELQKWSPDAEVMMRVEDVEIGNKNVLIAHVEQKRGTVYLIDENVLGAGGEKFGVDWGFTPEQVAEREKKEEEEMRRRAIEAGRAPISKERLEELHKHGGLVC